MTPLQSARSGTLFSSIQRIVSGIAEKIRCIWNRFLEALRSMWVSVAIFRICELLAPTTLVLRIETLWLRCVSSYTNASQTAEIETLRTENAELKEQNQRLQNLQRINQIQAGEIESLKRSLAFANSSNLDAQHKVLLARKELAARLDQNKQFIFKTVGYV